MVKTSINKPVEEELCQLCGLCCNGVLFRDVELQAGDDADSFRGLGLRVEGGKRKPRFRQPCACLEEGLCRIYTDRPGHCREFECGVLLRVKEGKLTRGAALKKIGKVKRQAAVVEKLLERLGDRDATESLNRRYARVMASPIDMAAGARAAQWRGKLMMAMDHLMELVQGEFLR